MVSPWGSRLLLCAPRCSGAGSRPRILASCVRVGPSWLETCWGVFRVRFSLPYFASSLCFKMERELFLRLDKVCFVQHNVPWIVAALLYDRQGCHVAQSSARCTRTSWRRVDFFSVRCLHALFHGLQALTTKAVPQPAAPRHEAKKLQWYAERVPGAPSQNFCSLRIGLCVRSTVACQGKSLERRKTRRNESSSGAQGRATHQGPLLRQNGGAWRRACSTRAAGSTPWRRQTAGLKI